MMKAFGIALYSAFAILAALIGAAGAQETDVDRPGGDYDRFASATWNDCANKCNEQSKCQAWTWVRPGVQGPNANCWLKSSVPGAQQSSCCISGVKLPMQTCQCRQGRWQVLSFTLESVEKNRGACRDAEVRAAGDYCAAFEPTTPPNGACWICFRSDQMAAGGAQPPAPGAPPGGPQCVAPAQTATPQATAIYRIRWTPTSAIDSGHSEPWCVTREELAIEIKKQQVYNPDAYEDKTFTPRPCPNKKCPTSEGYTRAKDASGGLICVKCAIGTYSAKLNCCI